MSLPKIKDFTDFNHYPSDPQPTTDADMQDYMQNQNDILAALTKRLWQPQTEYKLGDIVASDTMADGLVAVCTIAGVTSDIEPTWGVNEATVVDNSCTWIMRPAYCRIDELFDDNDVLPIANGGTGATTAEQARANLGIKDIATYDVLPIANGGTGATTAEQARKNLDANGFVTNLSVSGRTITYTKKDGTSGTITTQDTTIPSSITSKISITGGIVAHDGTIPIPSGYSRSQCRYAVWCHDMPDSNAGYGDATSGTSWHRVQVNQGTGAVYCMYQYNGSHRVAGKAGYLCVAVK